MSTQSNQNNGRPLDNTGADTIRENLKTTDGAERDAAALAKQLKAEGVPLAKKHGG